MYRPPVIVIAVFALLPASAPLWAQRGGGHGSAGGHGGGFAVATAVPGSGGAQFRRRTHGRRLQPLGGTHSSQWRPLPVSRRVPSIADRPIADRPIADRLSTHRPLHEAATIPAQECASVLATSATTAMATKLSSWVGTSWPSLPRRRDRSVLVVEIMIPRPTSSMRARRTIQPLRPAGLRPARRAG